MALSRHGRRLTSADLEAMAAFKQSVARSRCAVCHTWHAYPDAHHVVSQHTLRRAGREDLLWDTRNALPLCPMRGWFGKRCHERHTSTSQKVPLSALRPSHWEFAREALGDFAEDYLRRHYEPA